ncbi:hypothetical protein MCOR07_002413 [Pyricularia oryzae]|nr:hypothetical protein MCOR19_009556 [Pyricularia oryzae]KAI6497337.1 hypothetical protein MCOR18_000454 [Pyricularia oryzae]KAI6626575.1 hypothetical protein MCOR07_002413 [Pyricularia oryzae]
MTNAAAVAPARVPTPLLQRMKTPAKVATTSEPQSAATTTPTTTAKDTPVKTQQPRRAATATSRTAPVANDPLSERATTLLIRRALCPQQQQQQQQHQQQPHHNPKQPPPPIESVLPPLTSRNDVDLQLYAIIAIVLREFVQNWYAKITPDEDFVAEILLVIAHITRALEQRIRKVDLESLLFDELPELLDRHVTAYRTAHQPIVQPPLQANPREIYHSLWPTPALSPTPNQNGIESEERLAENEAAYRHLLVQGVLAVLLPTEDLENPCLTALVGQIIAELIIGGVVAKKASEPWMLYEGFCILARVAGRKPSSPSPDSRTMVDDMPPLTKTSKPSWAHSLRQLFWSAVQLGILAFTLMRTLITTITTYRSVPSRLGAASGWSVKGVALGQGPAADTEKSSTPYEPLAHMSTNKVPLLAFRIWPTLSNLIELDSRMPWLSGGLSLLQWLAMTGPGQLAGLDGPVDRLLSQAIAGHVLDPSQFPTILRTLRGVLFPNNAMGKSSLTPPANDEELHLLRLRCAASLYALIPRPLAKLYFGKSGKSNVGGGVDSSRPPTRSVPVAKSSSPPQKTCSSTDGPRDRPTGATIPARASASESRAAETNRAAAPTGYGPPLGHSDAEDELAVAELDADLLAVFSDAYCNKHLMYGIVELILVRLVPELAERGVVELLGERLS